MPTGWRPEDVKNKLPLKQIGNPYNQIKYKTDNSSMLITWSWIQHLIAGIIMFHLFTVMDIENPSLLDYLYGVFLFIHIFSFTSMLDHSMYSFIAEFIKLILGLALLYVQGNIWFNIGGIFSFIIVAYFITSFVLTINFYLKHKSLSV